MNSGPLPMPGAPPVFGGVELRPFTLADVDLVADLSTDPYVPLIGSLPPHADHEQAVAYIKRQLGHLKSGAGYPFVIADRSTGRGLGTAGLWLDSLAAGRATAGYSVAPSARGRGVAADGLTALTAFGWTVPALWRIELYIEPWNAASIRIAERAGYLREGLLRSHQVIGGRRVDMVLYASIRPE
jgi:[ribosomal protein S5]-alanine N-acetyltransferase